MLSPDQQQNALDLLEKIDEVCTQFSNNNADQAEAFSAACESLKDQINLALNPQAENTADTSDDGYSSDSDESHWDPLISISLYSPSADLIQLVELLHLASWVRNLEISCPHMQTLPTSLTKSSATALSLTSCPQLASIFSLPFVLEKLVVNNCANVATIAAAQLHSLRSITILMGTKLKMFTLPESLKNFILTENEIMSQLPEKWPNSLQSCELEGLRGLVSLPQALQTLNAEGKLRTINCTALNQDANNSFPKASSRGR